MLDLEKDYYPESMDRTLIPLCIEDIDLLKKYMRSRILGNDVPKIPKKLNGEIWAITSFFNPAKYKNKYENYMAFREASKKQGLKLLTVEMVFEENSSFEIAEEDTDILIQVLGGKENMLWQKEALINYALKFLPDICDKVIWIDCDIIFHNDNWVQETAELLNDYVAVQPFSSCIRLGRGLKTSNELKNITRGNSDNEIIHSLAKGASLYGINPVIRGMFQKHGHTGLAWAIRREVLEEHGLFEFAINGSGDSMMAYAFFGTDWANFYAYIPEHVYLKAKEWRKGIFKDVQSSVYFTEGIIDHLWHGSIKDRVFKERDLILFRNDFNPDKDLKKNQSGLLEWTGRNEKLREEIIEYFYMRKEEG